MTQTHTSMAPDTTFTHTIDGQAETSPDFFDVVNPSTGEAFARCPSATEAQFNRAVNAARRAFADWRRTTVAERRAYMLRMAEALRAQADALAPILTREQGKPLPQAKAEFERAAALFETVSQIEVPPEVLRDDADARVELHYRPLGVIGAITPWNVPIVLAVPKIIQALMTGNTVVLKPASTTPLATLKLGEIARGILPPGVLNVLAGGGGTLGRWMTEDPRIDKISFTGSSPVGKSVAASAVASSLKRVTLELGGNDAAIVLPDVDVKAMAPRIFQGAFANCGQICMAIKRLYVHESIYEEMVAELAELARTVKVGDGFEPGVTIGPLQNKTQYDIVQGILEDTKRQPGVRVVAGGHALDRPGYFIAPTIVADIEEGARLVDEEQFGPVLPVLRYSDVDDAIRRANDTRMGLGGSVWSKDLAKAAAVAAQLEVGTAWINHHIGTEPTAPFGGAKESGLGCEYSTQGMIGYMQAHVIKIPKTVS